MKKVLQITHKLKPGDDIEMALDIQSHSPGYLCAHAVSKSYSDQDEPDTIIALFECEDLDNVPKGMRVALITDKEFERLKAK